MAVTALSSDAQAYIELLADRGDLDQGALRPVAGLLLAAAEGKLEAAPGATLNPLYEKAFEDRKVQTRLMMEAITRSPVAQDKIDGATREFVRKVIAGREAELFQQLYEHTKEAIHKNSLEKLDAYLDRHAGWVSDLIATADAIQAGEGDQAAVLGGLLTESNYAAHADSIFWILGFICQWGQLRELMKDPGFLLPSFVNLSRIAANLVAAHHASEGVVAVANQVANGLAFGINVATYAYEVGEAGASEDLREAVEDAVDEQEVLADSVLRAAFEGVLEKYDSHTSRHLTNASTATLSAGGMLIAAAVGAGNAWNPVGWGVLSTCTAIKLGQWAGRAYRRSKKRKDMSAFRATMAREDPPVLVPEFCRTQGEFYRYLASLSIVLGAMNRWPDPSMNAAMTSIGGQILHKTEIPEDAMRAAILGESVPGMMKLIKTGSGTGSLQIRGHRY